MLYFIFVQACKLNNLAASGVKLKSLLFVLYGCAMYYFCAIASYNFVIDSSKVQKKHIPADQPAAEFRPFIVSLYPILANTTFKLFRATSNRVLEVLPEADAVSVKAVKQYLRQIKSSSAVYVIPDEEVVIIFNCVIRKKHYENNYSDCCC